MRVLVIFLRGLLKLWRKCWSYCMWQMLPMLLFLAAMQRHCRLQIPQACLIFPSFGQISSLSLMQEQICLPTCSLKLILNQMQSMVITFTATLAPTSLANNSLWQGQWKCIVNLCPQQYYLVPQGREGNLFLKYFCNELQGVPLHQWNSEWPLIFVFFCLARGPWGEQGM